MGFDATDDNTFGYCQSGDVPIFKLHKASTSEVINLVSDNIPEWENNQGFIVTLSGLEFPTTVSLHHAYPNPFNPSTTIEYEIPEGGMHINLSIYDIRSFNERTLHYTQKSIEIRC